MSNPCSPISRRSATKPAHARRVRSPERPAWRAAVLGGNRTRVTLYRILTNGNDQSLRSGDRETDADPRMGPDRAVDARGLTRGCLRSASAHALMARSLIEKRGRPPSARAAEHGSRDRLVHRWLRLHFNFGIVALDSVIRCAISHWMRVKLSLRRPSRHGSLILRREVSDASGQTTRSVKVRRYRPPAASSFATRPGMRRRRSRSAPPPVVRPPEPWRSPAADRRSAPRAPRRTPDTGQGR